MMRTVQLTKLNLQDGRQTEERQYVASVTKKVAELEDNLQVRATFSFRGAVCG